jgi:hypothetical protein
MLVFQTLVEKNINKLSKIVTAFYSPIPTLGLMTQAYSFIFLYLNFLGEEFLYHAYYNKVYGVRFVEAFRR